MMENITPSSLTSYLSSPQYPLTSQMLFLFLELLMFIPVQGPLYLLSCVPLSHPHIFPPRFFSF
jgi:hypothetical protein